MNALTELPHSDESEEQLISCCLIDGGVTVARSLEAGITPQSFYTEAHGIIFGALGDLHDRSVPIELVVLTEELNAAKQLEAVGGYPALTRMNGLAQTTIQAGYFIEQVRDNKTRREMIRMATEMIEGFSNLTGPISESFSSFETRLRELAASAQMDRSKGFTIWTIKDFEDYNPPADDAILADETGSIQWRDRELALMLGPGGVGKSRLTLLLAVAQILGWEFVGFKTFGPPRRWLFIGNENSVRRYKEDLARIMHGLGETERALLLSHLFIHALVTAEDYSLALDDPHALANWRSAATRCKPDILVADPWEAAIPGGDCNDSPATREGVRLLRAIFSCHSPRFSPLIAHHSKEGAEAARGAEGFNAGAYAKGSKTLRSMARFVINVAPEDPDDGGRAVLVCGKINDATKFRTRGAVLNAETGLYSINPDFDLDAWRADVEGKSGNKSCTIREVVEVVRVGVHKTGEIVERVHSETGASVRAIKNRLREAVEAGYLENCIHGTYTLGDKRL